MDGLFCADATLAAGLGFAPAGTLEGLAWFARRSGPRVHASKLTFTSGTTGSPKPVGLSSQQQWEVARALADVLAPLGLRRHLCLLPLAVLLENVAGVFAAELAGAECCVPPLAEVGMHGAATFDARACLAAIERWQAESVILLPQMLRSLTAALAGGAGLPRSLRFAAVGGAKVSRSLLDEARRLGLPVYEGYGLSECASVVSLNVPGSDRPGSVGRPLRAGAVHIRDGEIVARSGVKWVATGDLGRLDEEGFLHLDGRRGNVLITSFGRNVSPEWPEAELVAGRAIAQAAVFGEGRACLCAVLVPTDAAASDVALAQEVYAVNARLPDYARVRAWVRAEAPFTCGNGLATANGRPRRDAIWGTYGERLDALL
jgi:long-subunit acyl-CoA synthetase (AMP-forming)